MAKEWYLGLDIGAASVGFAATDTQYNILTKSGKLQCGARLFKEAEDASTRRGFRSSRRRFARRKVRIDLLQSLFDSAIAEKDDAFFIRLNESNLRADDKSASWRYPLFNDAGFSDKDYYEKFPTIYHLRKHLLENEVDDVRLIYLACHHLVKYRGHFLFSRFDVNDSSCRDELLKELNDLPVSASLEDDAVVNALKGNKVISTQKNMFKDDFEKDELDEFKEALKEINEELKNYKFSHEQFEECHELASATLKLNESQSEYILKLKKLYDFDRATKILGEGNNYIAEAMVERYDEHKVDLKLLKDFIRKHLPYEYDGVFRENGIYSNYVGSNITHGKSNVSHCGICKTAITTINHEEFLAEIAKIIAKASDKDGCAELQAKIDNKSLGKIHNTQDNAYIPHQLQAEELRAILQKQSHFGLDSDKIVSLLTFRIPYYIGPLQGGGKFAWIVKNEGFEGERVLPWNFDEVVNKAASGERFIGRMTAKCTYLTSEDVIPKQSLLYQRYMLLNDLNNLKINGNRIQQELKLFLFNTICQEEMSLTKAKIKKHLIAHGKIDKSDEVGKENENDTAFNSSLSSLIRFKGILDDELDLQMCENIIKWHTVFGDEKSPVKQRIEAEYGTLLTSEQIDKLSKMTFKGWARFSAKFLSGITTTDKSTGETALTIMMLLEETTLNLMELLNSDSYTPKFIDTVASENAGGEAKLDYDGLVKDLYCSPIVKRSIWQAIMICKELAKINKCPPKKVFIEVTRAKDMTKKGKKTSSRRKQIEELLNKAVKTGQDLTQLVCDFNGKTDEREFRSDRLYLYFTQLGKCMYSGEPIALSDLNTDNYDIDHIYPQSKIKDDSLTNRVLVKRSANADKTDTYPIADSVRYKMKPFWVSLKSKGLINAEKYSRLTCSQELSYDLIGGFINRQLVSTNQAVKETANALGLLFGDDTEIVYSKARNVTDFRNNHELIKCREVNNLHHAHDAYLNVVVGNVWDSVYGHWKTNFTFNEDRAIDRLFQVEREGIWKRDYITKIKDYLLLGNDNKKYLDKFPVTTRPYEVKGAFYDQTIHPARKGQFELKAGLSTDKYGGYKSGYNAYNCVIEYDGKGKSKGTRLRGVFPVPVRFVGMDEEALLCQIASVHKLQTLNPTLVIPKILMFSVLEIDGVRYHMRSGDLQCSVTTEWYPDKEIVQIVRNIFRYKQLVADRQLTADKDTFGDIVFATRERNKHNKESKAITREGNLMLFDAIIAQVKKPFYANYTFAKKVADGRISREKFEGLTTFEQMEQLASLLNLITMNGVFTNALKIGGVKNETCKYIANTTLSGDVCLITQSVTGLFESRVVVNKKEPLS